MTRLKKRIDTWLVEKGYAENLKLAQAMILSGNVVVNDQRVSNASQTFNADAKIRFKKDRKQKVGRGYDKLKGALNSFQVNPKNKICLDLGASTGGFTQCLLEAGAKRVYAVDVGTNQLAWNLRREAKVISLEKTHANKLNDEMIGDRIDLLTVDVSFTSLKNVLPFVWPLMEPDGLQLVLFKPQFECSREEIGPGGIVGDEKVILSHITAFRDWVTEMGFSASQAIPCVIRGKDSGNQEFFLQLKAPQNSL